MTNCQLECVRLINTTTKQNGTRGIAATMKCNRAGIVGASLGHCMADTSLIWKILSQNQDLLSKLKVCGLDLVSALVLIPSKGGRFLICEQGLLRNEIT